MSGSCNAMWKYSVRLEETHTPCFFSKMLDFWGHGNRSVNAISYTAENFSEALPPPPASSFGAATTSAASSSSSAGAGSSAGKNKLAETKNVNQLYRPSLESQYLIFACADGPRFMASHAVARMCDSLGEILDELDVFSEDEIRPNNILELEAQRKQEEEEEAEHEGAEGLLLSNDRIELLVQDCAVLDVSISGKALEGVLVYLSMALEKGTTSVLPYPLQNVPINSLIFPWEKKFLEEFAPAFPSSGATGVGAGEKEKNSQQQNQQHGGMAGGMMSGPGGSGSQDGTEMMTMSSNTLLGGDQYGPPPLLALLRASDYLGINSLRDLTCAALASKLFETRDENRIAEMLGVEKLPKDSELEDVYSRFPFLDPNSSSNSVAQASSSPSTTSAASSGGGGRKTSSSDPSGFAH